MCCQIIFGYKENNKWLIIILNKLLILRRISFHQKSDTTAIVQIIKSKIYIMALPTLTKLHLLLLIKVVKVSKIIITTLQTKLSIYYCSLVSTSCELCYNFFYIIEMLSIFNTSQYFFFLYFNFKLFLFFLICLANYQTFIDKLLRDINNFKYITPP